jgi:RNA polymerase sigma factor (sigma-70 family)
LLTDRLHNEEILVEQMQSGNEESFTLLYKHYSPLLYLNILRMVHDPLTAEEMVQELFTRIWQKRKSTAIKEKFSGYLYRTAINLVHDFFRKLKRDHKLFQKFQDSVEESYKHIEEGVNNREATESLLRAIEQLPPQQKKVYQLVREEGFTYKKAAEILNISPFTVKEYLSSTTKTIRRYLVRHADSATFFVFLLLSRL